MSPPVNKVGLKTLLEWLAQWLGKEDGVTTYIMSFMTYTPIRLIFYFISIFCDYKSIGNL